MVPSCPLLFTKTGSPRPRWRAPKIPAMKVLVWTRVPRGADAADANELVIGAEMPGLPMWMLLLPVVTMAPAPLPMAMLPVPVVFKPRAPIPRAVLLLPVVLPGGR